MALGEYVVVLPQERCECLKDRRASQSSNLGHLFGPGIVQDYPFQLLYQFRHHLLLLYTHSLQMDIHLQHGNVALVHHHLISPYFSHSTLSWEFYH